MLYNTNASLLSTGVQVKWLFHICIPACGKLSGCRIRLASSTTLLSLNRLLNFSIFSSITPLLFQSCFQGLYMAANAPVQQRLYHTGAFQSQIWEWNNPKNFLILDCEMLFCISQYRAYIFLIRNRQRNCKCDRFPIALCRYLTTMQADDLLCNRKAKPRPACV